MEKDDSLITGQSVVPEPDAGCAETCYYVGWSWDHAHKAAEQPVAPAAPADSTAT